MTELQTQLRSCLTQALSPTWLELRDDSAAHAGHAGAREGAHFFAHVVSERFRGLQLLQRHRHGHERARKVAAVDRRDVGGWQRCQRAGVVPVQQVTLEAFQAFDGRERRLNSVWPGPRCR